METAALRTGAEPDDTPAADQDCDHFSIRGYVALLQKKDPKFCTLSQIFCNQQSCNEHHNNQLPLSATKYRRWNCSNCLDKVKKSDHRTTSGAVSTEQDETPDDCTVSFVRTLPRRVDSRRLFSFTLQSSQGNAADKSTLSKGAQECNSKCSSPSGNKGVIVVNVPDTFIEKNVPDTTIETNVPDMFVEANVSTTKGLQGWANNLDVMGNILNDVSVDVSDSPGVPQMISSKAGNDTQNPCTPKPCKVPNDDENGTTQDVPNIDCNVSNAQTISGQKRSKPIFGHKSSQVCSQGPRGAALKRNVGSDSKKKSKSTGLVDISDLKFCQRKPKKMRLLSELIDTDQAGTSADATIGDDHANTGDLFESDKGKLSLEVEKNNDTPVSNHEVGEIQSRTGKDKKKLRGLDNVDDGSSLMNWLRKTQKKVRIEKKDSAHKSASAVSNSNPETPASNDTHHGVLYSIGDLGQKKVSSTTSAKHGNILNNNLERNMQKAGGMCQNESEMSKKRFLLNESMVLLKRKLPSTATAHDENAANSTTKRSMLRADDLCQMEPESTVQRCLSKVSLGKRKTQNVPGLHKQKMPKSKKKQKVDMHEKQTLIDDIPMDIVELLARNQHERQLMADTDSLGNNHSGPKITAVDSAPMATMDGPLKASTVLDTNFQKSLASDSKQKSIQGHASSGTEAASVHLLELQRQMSSQCHAVSSTVAPNGHHPESHMQNSLETHAASITGSVNVYPPKLHIPDLLDCTQEQRTHFRRDEEVTIACTSPIFSRHQHIAEVPTQSWSNKGEKKLMWDSFKTASRNSPTSTYGFQFRNGTREVDSASNVYGASNNYQTHQPMIVAVNHYAKKAVNQVQLRSIPSTALTMDAGRVYDHRIAGQSGLYPKETIPATHLLRLMDSSTALGFTSYETVNRNQMEYQTPGSQYTHNQYKASPSTSYGNHLIEKVPLTLHDLSRHPTQQNLHKPLRPHPRVGVLGSLLQQDIAKWSQNCGTQSGYQLQVSKGMTSFDVNRKENYETLNSGMFSAGWNALQLGSVSSVANPEFSLPRYGIAQPWSSGSGKTVHPLDKLVRKDICMTNRNPADFTVISDNNEYMINL